MKISGIKSFVLFGLIGLIGIGFSSLFSELFSRPLVGFIKFQDFNPNQVFQVLTVLFLIALFFERALEVYVLTFRKAKEEEYESIYQNSSSDEAKEKLINHKNETRRIALWAALLGGILIGMIGVRGLEPFTNLSENTPQWQYFYFRVLDIFLTGAVIAGGSQPIHQILQVFTTFMDAIAIKNKAQANTPN